MRKILNLIKRHIILFILCLLAFIVLIIMLVAFLQMSINTSGKYGNRLDGIEEVSISKSELKDIENKLEEKDEVVKASVRIQGRIIYFDIYFGKDVSLENAKKICNEMINSFEEDEQKYYDISFIITQDSEEDKWNASGSKNSESDAISWTKN